MAWYSVNKLSVTQNSAVVTGNATQFASFVYPGFGIFIEKVPYEVASVDSPTQITLADPYRGLTKSDASYSIWPTQGLNAEVWKSGVDLIETFGPLRNNMNLLTQQIADTLSYKDAASTSAIVAGQRASEALTSATNAANSATAAANSATAAAGSATAANTSKNNAATSATASANSASDANASKQSAASSAADALANKNATQSLKDQTDTAKTAAVAAQIAAEAARDVSTTKAAESGTFRDQSVAARNASQTAQTASEGARDTALAHRNAASASAAGAATSETNAASYKAAAETAKNGSETARDASAASASASAGSATTAEGHKTAAANSATAAQNAQAAAELAAEQAAEPVNEYAIREALGGTPALLEGATFTGAVTVPSNLTVTAQDNDTEGGQIVLKRAANQGIQGDMVIDTQSNHLRIFDNVATGRMLAWDAVNGQLQVNGQYVYHTGNNPTKAAVGLGNVDNTSDAAKPISTATQNALNAKQTALGYTPVQQGTGTGQGPNVVKIGWSGTRLKATVDWEDQGNFVFDAQMTKANVGLGNVDNTSDANKPVSTATQNALNAKASINSPTFNNAATVNGAASSNRLFWAATNGAARWSFGSDAAGETQFNGGSDFSIHRYANDGSWLGQPFAINRSTGRSQFNAQVSIIDGNQLLLKANSASNPTLIHRNDGSNYYLLLSANSTAPSDTFNSLRPLSINTSTGALSSANGQNFQGGQTLRGGVWSGDNMTIEHGSGPMFTLNQSGGTNADSSLSFNRNGVRRWNIGDGWGNDNWYVNRYDNNGNYASTPIQIRKSDGQTITNGLSVAGNLDVSGAIYTGGGNGGRNSIRIGDDVWLGDINSGNCLNIRGEQDSNQGWLCFGNSNLRFGRGSNGDYFHLEGDLKVMNWIRASGNNGLYWENHGRGIRAAGIDSGYGNIDVYGNGANGWAGVSIGTWNSYMSNGSETGLYCQQRGLWHLRFDGNNDAWFPANVVAYSDERLKDNIRPIDDVAARRKGLAKAAITYERDGRTRIGYGAQTLRKSNPEFVLEADDITKTLSVAYAETTAVLAVDLDNQASRIDELEQDNAQLRDRLTKLENIMTKAGFL